jgi:hypothetical protein
LKPFLRILLYSSLTLILIAGVGLYVLRTYLQKIILHRLRAEIETTFDNYYHLEYGEIKTSLIDGDFGIKIIRPVFSTDTTQKFYLSKYPAFYFKADSIEIGKINIERLFISQSIKFDFISLDNPELTFLLGKQKPDKQSEGKPKKTRKLIDEIFFKKLQIVKGNVSILHLNDPEDTLYYGEDIDLSVINTRIPVMDPKGIYAASKIENVLFSMSNVRFYPDKSPYAFLMNELRFNAQENFLKCRKVSMQPEKSLLKMSTSSRYQKTFAKIHIGNILLRGIDFYKIGEPALSVRYAEIANSNFNLLRNRHMLLDKSAYKKSFQENLKEIELPINIDSLHFSNIHLNVTVHFPNNNPPATIRIHNMSGTLLHINNDSATSEPMQLHANATIMKTGKLVFDASFPIHNQTHTYTARISNMPFAEWNEVISRLANVQLTSGNIKQIKLKGDATSMETNGNIVFEYRDLQATVFKKTKSGDLKKAKGMTYLANGILRLHNPDKGEMIPVSKDYYFKREPWQGQIMLWVGGLLDGIEATLLNERLKKRVDEIEAEKLKTRKR